MSSSIELSGIDTSDATATANKMLTGYTAYVDGSKLTGEYVPLDTSDATATAAKILSGFTAYAKGNKLTGNYVPPTVSYTGIEQFTGGNMEYYTVQHSGFAIVATVNAYSSVNISVQPYTAASLTYMGSKSCGPGSYNGLTTLYIGQITSGARIASYSNNSNYPAAMVGVVLYNE